MLVGTLSGFLGGLLGIGGGIVIVPALILLFGAFGLLPDQVATLAAIATSLACIVFTSLSAAYAQYKSNKIEWSVARRWGPYLVLGSLFAGMVASRLPVATLRACIGLFLVFVAVVMLTSWKPAPSRPFPGTLGSAVAGWLGGLVSGIAGIGGGNVIVPSLIFFNVPVHRATATSSALGVPIAAAGFLGYMLAAWQTEPELPTQAMLLGYLYWPAFLAITLPAIALAPLGVKVAHRTDPLPLRRLFGGLLLLLAARMLYSAWAVWAI